MSEAPPMDIVYLPALWRNPRKVLSRVSYKLDSWLMENAKQGAEIAAVGSGVSLLARTGLLDEKPATTHWHYFEEFSQQFPNVNLKPDFHNPMRQTSLCREYKFPSRCNSFLN